jgi:hypothetical protein
LELLLLLTALFASLTGTSGDRGVHAVQGVAVVRLAESVQAAAEPRRQFVAAAAALPGAPRATAIRGPHIAAAPVSPLRLAFEQRRE